MAAGRVEQSIVVPPAPHRHATRASPPWILALGVKQVLGVLVDAQGDNIQHFRRRDSLDPLLRGGERGQTEVVVEERIGRLPGDAFQAAFQDSLLQLPVPRRHASRRAHRAGVSLPSNTASKNPGKACARAAMGGVPPK